jgi:AcrR family transcriptional regulator
VTEVRAPGRGRPPRARAAAPAAGTDDAVREARGTRRRRETRARLLNAALKLMADRGMDAIAINEITEAADVGFGSFYNHFESKEAIHRALTDLVLEEFADALDRALSGVTDPAEVIAASVRHTLYRGRRDRTWALFLLRESLSSRMLTRGLGARLLRDIEKGISTRRFDVDDALTAFLGLAGSVLTALSVEVQYGESADSALSSELRLALGLPSPELPERVATSLLRFLGVPLAEAQHVARRQLTKLEAPKRLGD